MTVIGWKTRTWKVPAPCVTCPREGITTGITHVHDDGDPPSHAMCPDCHRALMEDPEHFEDRAQP